MINPHATWLVLASALLAASCLKKPGVGASSSAKASMTPACRSLYQPVFASLPTKLPRQALQVPRSATASFKASLPSPLPSCFYQNYDLTRYRLEEEPSAVERQAIVDDFVQATGPVEADANDVKSRLGGVLPNGLSPEEAAAVFRYTGALYDDVNQSLRQINAEPLATLNQASTIKVLASALSKLDPVEATVWRATAADLAALGIDPANLSRPFVSPTFWSATKQKATAGAFKTAALNQGKPVTMFTITSHLGRAIERLSMHSGEEEVLFAPGTEFKITEVTQKGKITYVVMTEITSLTPVVDPIINAVPQPLTDGCSKIDCTKLSAPEAGEAQAESSGRDARDAAASGEAPDSTHDAAVDVPRAKVK